MSDEQTKPDETAEISADDYGDSRYPDEAFEAVSEGLSYAIQKVHGPETAAHRRLARLMLRENLDWIELASMYDAGRLPEPIAEDIEEIGGADKLNRHISGRELCWGLRDFALKRWGLLARTVLSRWNINETIDFGRIVFETIERGHMQRQPDDSVDDFNDIYDFSEAFDEVFRMNTKEPDDEESPHE